MREVVNFLGNGSRLAVITDFLGGDLLLIGAIEAGGTKFVCGVGTESGEIINRVTFPTSKPELTLAKVLEYFRDKKVSAVGIGCFGPIELNRSNPNYGFVTSTPKLEWSNYPVLPILKSGLNVPIGWDTDVNVAALGEATWGAAKGLDSCIYYTIGTGIGVGVIAEGKLVHGLVHSEGGHVSIRRHPNDGYLGNCPFHADCLEGMAAGPAILGRWNINGSDLPSDHPAWEFEAYYIGQAVANAILMLSPKKVILGGGVMNQTQLFPLIREQVVSLLNGYVSKSELINAIEDYIIPPLLGNNAGLCGSIALGIHAIQEGGV